MVHLLALNTMPRRRWPCCRELYDVREDSGCTKKKDVNSSGNLFELPKIEILPQRCVPLRGEDCYQPVSAAARKRRPVQDLSQTRLEIIGFVARTEQYGVTLPTKFTGNKIDRQKA